jgi:hypothetical protein
MTFDEAMNQALKNVFTIHYKDKDTPSRYGILSFYEELYSQFYNEGFLEGDFWEDELNSSFNEPPYRFAGGLCIVLLQPDYDDLYSGVNENGLENVLRHAHFAYYDGTADKLQLLSKESLFDILPRLCRDALCSELPLLDVYPESSRTPALKETTVARFKNKKDYSGRTFWCECQEPLCISEYALIRNGVVLIYIYHGSGGFLDNIWLLPFKTTAYCIDDKS